MGILPDSYGSDAKDGSSRDIANAGTSGRRAALVGARRVGRFCGAALGNEPDACRRSRAVHSLRQLPLKHHCSADVLAQPRIRLGKRDSICSWAGADLRAEAWSFTRCRENLSTCCWSQRCGTQRGCFARRWRRDKRLTPQQPAIALVLGPLAIPHGSQIRNIRLRSCARPTAGLKKLI
jgi:hypothetical protein